MTTVLRIAALFETPRWHSELLAGTVAPKRSLPENARWYASHMFLHCDDREAAAEAVRVIGIIQPVRGGVDRC